MRYVTTICPIQDPQGCCPYLLCLAGGKQLTNFNTRFKTLAKNYSLKPLTATEVRKRASTEAARNLSSPEAALVTRQLFHSTETDARFYQALSGPSHASEAFLNLKKMRQKRKYSPPAPAPVSSNCPSHPQLSPDQAEVTTSHPNVSPDLDVTPSRQVDVTPSTNLSPLNNPTTKKRRPLTLEEEEM